MKSSDIITLLNAGYTKAEIEAMDQPAQNEPAQTQAEPTQTQTEPAKTQTQTPEDAYTKLEKLLNQFINTARASNLNANMAGAVQQKDATDILAGVIAPPENKKGRK